MVTRGKPIKASIADMTLEKQIGKTNFRHDISNNEAYCLQRAYPSRLSQGPPDHSVKAKFNSFLLKMKDLQANH